MGNGAGRRLEDGAGELRQRGRSTPAGGRTRDEHQQLAISILISGAAVLLGAA